MSLLHMPTPRITAPTRVCSPLGISKPAPRPVGRQKKFNTAEYYRDFKRRHPEKYALRQRITNVRKGIRYYEMMQNDTRVESLKAELIQLEAKRRELKRG